MPKFGRSNRPCNQASEPFVYPQRIRELKGKRHELNVIPQSIHL